MDTTLQNPNADFFNPGQGGNPTGSVATPTPPTSINSTNTNPNTPSLITSPTPTTPNYAGAINSIPTVDSIENATNPNTTPEATALKSSQTRLENLMASLGGKSADQQAADQANGVTDITNKLTDLNSQITTLKNQATAIPQIEQQNAQGKGITAGGLAPIQTADLRNNSIQALTLNSLAATLQGNLTVAKAAADKAVALKYDPIEAQIKAAQQQITDNMPFFTAAEKKQAEVTQAKLADRQRMLDQQKADTGTIMSWGAAALKNGATNLQAQAISNAPDLKSAFALYAPFATNPQETQKALLELQQQRANIARTNAETANLPLDAKLKQAQINNTNASAAKTRAETNGLGGGNGGVSDELKTAINNGTIDPNRINSRTLGIYNAIAKAGVDAVGSHAGAVGETKSVENLSAYKSTATRTLGVIDKNLPLVAALADKVNQTGVPALDDYIRCVKSYTGNNPDIIKYVNSIKTLRSEYAQMLSKGSVATEGDKADAAQAIPSGLSSAGYNALGQQLKLEATNIISASDDAIRAAKNKSASNIGSSATSQTGSTVMTGPDGKQYNVPNDKVDGFIKAGGHK